MSILWADNFNIYGPAGVGDARAQQGFWNGMLVTVPAFETTGKRWMRVAATSGFQARRGVGGTFTAMGLATRFHFQQYPPANNARIRQYDAGASRTLDVEFTADGNIRVVNSAGVVVTQTTTPCFFPGTSHKLQYQMTYHATLGEFQLKIDGVDKIGGTSGVNGSNLVLNGNMTSIGIQDQAGDAANDWYVDFMVPYSLTGTYNSNWPNISGVANLQLNGAPINNFPGRPFQLFGAGQIAADTASASALDCSTSANFDLGAGDYTLETYYRHDLNPTGTNLAMIFGKWNEATNNRSYRLVQYGPSVNNGTLRFEITTTGAIGSLVTVWQTSVPPAFIRGRWYLISVSRTAGVTRVFINGRQIGLAVADANTYFAAGTNAKFSIGAMMNGVGTGVQTLTTALGARYDEPRVTVGVGRYTANFALPGAPWPRTVGGDPSFASVQLVASFDNSVVDESTTAPKTITLRGAMTRATPLDASANYLSAQPLDPEDSRYIETPFLPATNVLEASVNFANTETVTVGATTYTFNTVLGGANSILIGATTLDSLTNLMDAINLGPGIGTRYGVGTVANASAFAVLGPTVANLTAQALVNGAAGNAIVSTETAANAVWLDGATFVGGADIPAASEYTMSALPPTATGIRALFLVDLSYVPSDNASLQKSLVVSGVAAAGAINPLGITPSYRGDVFEQDPNTGAALTPTSVVNGRIRLARTA